MSIESELLQKYFVTAIRLTKECGQIIGAAIMKAKNVESKTCDIDLVTETDREVEKLLIGGLKEHFPTHKFIGEESAVEGQPCELTDDPTWVIDPVDGTMNFVHGLPLVAISIGLLIKKESVLGIIYNPLLDQLFTAKIGHGAFLNGKPIKVSGEIELAKALVCSEAGSSKDPERVKVVLNNLTKLIGKVHGIRALGSAALNMASVASGAVDAYYEQGVHAWDMCAGEMIVKEAGGSVIDITGGPFDLLSRRVVCAASEKLAREIASLLEYVELERD